MRTNNGSATLGRCCCLLLVIALMATTTTTTAFTLQLARRQSTLAAPLFAKGSGGGKGFGSKVATSTSSNTPASLDESSAPSASSASSTSKSSSSFLQSAEGAESTPVQMDQSMPPEERTKLILKQQYGLKTLEEQRLTEAQLELYKEKQKKQAALKKKIANNEALDIMNMLPPSVLVGIDRFLKAGLFTCGTLFILAGLFITAEAWSKASNQPLPENLDNFIVNIVEPNFTPGLLVLLGFSVSLGAFAALQLSSSSSQYKED
jgi:hypothetical protein